MRATPEAPPPPDDPAFAEGATVVVGGASVWFGANVALNEVSCSFGPGVTGLLGPNGAGKTTLMRAICGMLPPNVGTVRVGGLDPRTQREAQRALALVPEEDASPGPLSARQLVRYAAAIHGVRDRDAPERALAAVDLLDVADREVGNFSKGMLQRTKVAAALVSDPSILVLDEPLNGADPVQRVALIELFNRLGDEGRTVIVSSHVLHEVERLARRQIVLVRGRLAAAGDHHAIRNAIADRPRQVLLRSSDPRRLAAALVEVEAVSGVGFDGDDVVVSSLRALDLAHALPGLARRAGIRLLEVRPLDDSLESAFRELVR
ncbi:MAG TPA: ABC transporter ATP-binding protein [Actinomycetota bacterium]|nr:ABC transporter ATP-binding protein [Actinomycetota bacterium]